MVFLSSAWGQPHIDYLRHACQNHQKGIAVPSLLPKIVNFQKIA